jgi:hypothetical protein
MPFVGVVLLLMALGLWLLLDHTPDVEPENLWTHEFTSPDGAPWCEQWMDDGSLCNLHREEHDEAYPESACVLMPEEAHKYQPNKADPGHCAALVPVRNSEHRPCLLSKEFHDE